MKETYKQVDVRSARCDSSTWGVEGIRKAALLHATFLLFFFFLRCLDVADEAIY